jgi:Zn-finger nucleic acid-binding protein
MRELEVRYPCPVCLGVIMDKTPVGRPPVGRPSAGQGGTLLLDHCGRCGGVWFEAGEVQRLHGYRPELLWEAIAQRSEPFRMQCHGCQSFVERDATACNACGWRNVLDCPVCQRPMETATHRGVKLDACRSCKGVWFDHSELASVWLLAFATSLRNRQSPSRVRGAAEDGTLVVLDALMYTPWLVVDGMRVAGHAAAMSADALGGALAHAPEAASVVVEAAGDAAAGVFETVVEILCGLFS